ncbi:MAG TPA: SCO family protein [Povalibacter sp.]|uniref:SCO family protein n=1 Tax=Povalibacter sp. TaxID=1962978 RepID=UPI002C25EBF4|nr:SCO family protein [Povalibacter sp.]HMN46354.1 SCO family protein [Povalibacter sp.]
MKSIAHALLALLAMTCAHAGPVNAPASIYNLQVSLTDQAGVAHDLDLYRGHPVLITMFYGSCSMTCPLLIDTLRAVDRSVPAQQRKDLRVLMITIDPEHDTPQALQTLAQERRIDTSRWTLANTDEKSVRKLAALLDIQYRPLPNGGYNHSSIVTLLSQDGEILVRSSVLGKADAALIAGLQQTSPILTGNRHPD